MHCPSCEGVIEHLMDIQNTQPVRKGNIVICGLCATVCKIGDSDLVKATKEDIAALDAQSRSMIIMTCAGIAHKNKLEKKHGELNS